MAAMTAIAAMVVAALMAVALEAMVVIEAAMAEAMAVAAMATGKPSDEVTGCLLPETDDRLPTLQRKQKENAATEDDEAVSVTLTLIITTATTMQCRIS